MRIIVNLISFMRTFGRLVSLAILLGWSTSVSWIALISASSYLISYAALQPSIAELQVAIVGVRFFGLSRGLLRYSERLISHSVTFKLLANLRVWFYQKVEALPAIEFQELQKGDVFSRILDDVELLQEFYVRVFGPTIIAFLTSFSIIWFSSRWSIKISLVLLCFHFGVGVLIPMVVRKISMQASSRLVGERSMFSVQAIDSIQGAADILAFGNSATVFQRLDSIILLESGTEDKLNRIKAISSGVVSTTIGLITIPLFAILIPMVNSNILDGKLLAVIILGSMASFEAIMTLPAAYQNLDESIAAGKRLFDYANIPAMAGEEPLSLSSQISLHLEIKNLCFSYSHNFSIDNVNLSLPFGKKLAVVGESGSGKTTLIKLVMRLYSPQQGVILFNGRDIREINEDYVRMNISCVAQTMHIFNGTVEENIRLGKPTATMDEIFRVAEKAYIHQFVLSLPMGYQTLIGEGGTSLSGGERQKLSIARGMLREAPLYIFDEPYVNLDQITQKMLSRSILNHVKNQSLLLVTHHLIGLSQMDEILVMRDGKIVENGTENELLSWNSFYKKLFEIQRDYLYLKDPNN